MLSVIWGFIFLFCTFESGSTKYLAVDLSYRDIYQILAPLCTGGLFVYSYFVWSLLFWWCCSEWRVHSRLCTVGTNRKPENMYFWEITSFKISSSRRIIWNLIKKYTSCLTVRLCLYSPLPGEIYIYDIFLWERGKALNIVNNIYVHNTCAVYCTISAN